jgi:hypothetical protein
VFCQRPARFRGKGADGLTDQDLKVVNVLAVGAPSCANVAVLLLEGLEEELERLFPVCSVLDWKDKAFCDRHFELCDGYCTGQ